MWKKKGEIFWVKGWREGDACSLNPLEIIFRKYKKIRYSAVQKYLHQQNIMYSNSSSASMHTGDTHSKSISITNECYLPFHVHMESFLICLFLNSLTNFLFLVWAKMSQVYGYKVNDWLLRTHTVHHHDITVTASSSFAVGFTIWLKIRKKLLSTSSLLVIIAYAHVYLMCSCTGRNGFAYYD